MGDMGSTKDGVVPLWSYVGDGARWRSVARMCWAKKMAGIDFEACKFSTENVEEKEHQYEGGACVVAVCQSGDVNPQYIHIYTPGILYSLHSTMLFSRTEVFTKTRTYNVFKNINGTSGY
jgi:hypothetical protein